MHEAQHGANTVPSCPCSPLYGGTVGLCSEWPYATRTSSTWTSTDKTSALTPLPWTEQCWWLVLLPPPPPCVNWVLGLYSSRPARNCESRSPASSTGLVSSSGRGSRWEFMIVLLQQSLENKKWEPETGSSRSLAINVRFQSTTPPEGIHARRLALGNVFVDVLRACTPRLAECVSNAGVLS
jgi:hypothetical protein